MTKKTIKILAIDDNSDNLVVMKALIIESFPGALFVSADSGKKGIELCQTERPDVILLDIVMPGMDGYEVCEKIKSDSRLRHIPVVMVTASRTGKASRVRALESGADAFLLKPVDESELKAQIRAMIRIKESEDLKIAEKKQLEDLVLDRTEALEMELADRRKAEDKLIQSLEKLKRNRHAILNLMEDLKAEISERRMALAELLKSKVKAEESDRLKTAFLHNISHEIRTPMNAIIGFSTLLNEPGLDKETQSSYTEIIAQSCNNLLNIVSDIIEISNIETGLIKLNKRETNLNLIITDCYTRFRKEIEEKSIGFSYETALSDSDSVIITDVSKLIQVITNLINNAVKFTSTGQIIFGYKHKNEQIEFFVSDTGIGIPQEHHSRIFDRFYKVEDSESRLYEGTGLGLPISKAFIELMGGTIWLTSRAGGGTTVFFTIPFENIEHTTIQISHNETKTYDKEKGKKTILIAEDEDNNFRLMQAILERHDYNIIHAGHGQKAVEIYESGREVDLIIMDIKMPVMDGYEATRIIKKINPTVPIIAITAFAFESDMEKALSAGCDEYLSKPVKSEILLAMIKKYI